MTDQLLRPQVPEGAAHNGGAGGVRLYSPFAVGLATFLGSPLAGGVVMAINYRRMGRPWAAAQIVLWTTVVSAASFVVAMYTPVGPSVPHSLLPGAQTLVMIVLAKVLQGFRIDMHQSEGGAMASNWRAAGIGVMGLGLVLGVVVGLVYLLPAQSHPWGSRYASCGGGSRVYHSEDISPDVAEAAGRALLRAAGLDSDWEFRLTREGRSHALWVALADDDHDNVFGVNRWRTWVAQTSAVALDCAPIEVRFCDEGGEVIRREEPLRWGRVAVISGRECVFYAHGATEKQAQAVGRALTDLKIFTGWSTMAVHLRGTGGGYELHVLLPRYQVADKKNMAAWQAVIKAVSTGALDNKPLKLVPVISGVDRP